MERRLELMKNYYSTLDSVNCADCYQANKTELDNNGAVLLDNFEQSYPDGVTCSLCGEVSTTDLSTRVNATVTITYDVNEVRKTLAELNGIKLHEVKDYEITDLIQSWLAEDFGSLSEQITLQDENGEELGW